MIVRIVRLGLIVKEWCDVTRIVQFEKQVNISRGISPYSEEDSFEIKERDSVVVMREDEHGIRH